MTQTKPVNLQELHRQVCFGESKGKIIWQPRIGCWYTDKKFAGDEFPELYQGEDLAGIYRELGCSARLYEFNECLCRVEDPTVWIAEKKLNETDTETTINTPVGKQVSVTRIVPDNWHPMRLKWEVETEEELKVAAWREEHTTWKWDQHRYEELLNALGDLGAPTVFLPRMNVQSLFIERMGVKNAVSAVYKWDAVEDYFKALKESHNRLIDVINQCPIEIVNFGENVHAGTMSRDFFLRYHLPACPGALLPGTHEHR